MSAWIDPTQHPAPTGEQFIGSFYLNADQTAYRAYLARWCADKQVFACCEWVGDPLESSPHIEFFYFRAEDVRAWMHVASLTR